MSEQQGLHDSGSRLRRDEDIDALVADLCAQVAVAPPNPEIPAPQVMSYVARARGRRLWERRWAWGMVTPLDPQGDHEYGSVRAVTADGGYCWTAWQARKVLTEALHDYLDMPMPPSEWKGRAASALFTATFLLAMLATAAVLLGNPATTALIAAAWTTGLTRLGLVAWWNRYADYED